MPGYFLFRCEVTFDCPFCGLACEAGEAKETETSEPGPAVMHKEPTCETYDKGDALEFMEAVNAKTQQIKRGS
jgi:hypothetical protein